MFFGFLNKAESSLGFDMWESSSKHPEKGEWGEGSAVNVFVAQA